MVAFHYIICDVPRKDKYHVVKLIFVNGKMENVFFWSKQLSLTYKKPMKGQKQVVKTS